MLGKLEEMILMATMSTGPAALPSTIYERLADTTPAGQKSPAFGAVYTTINRMTVKKLLLEGKTIDERGRDRRTFTVSASGQSALFNAHQHVHALGGLRLAGGFA